MNPEEVDNGSVQEDEGLGWGKSLPVPSVQEMVRKDSQSVPERYIQEHNNRPLDSEFSPDLCEIPIINFSLLANGDEEEQRKLDIACKEWGFFQITDHGVTEKVLHDMKAAEAAFFELPLEEKKKYAMGENDLQGYGQGYVVSEQQKLEWCDLIFLVTLPPNIRKFKHWPVSIPGFKEAVETYSTEMQKVAEELLANLSLLMGMEREDLKSLHGEMKQAMRMNYYPLCSRPELVLGISPHSDASTITLLIQDDDINGLQIRQKQKWVPIKPIPNAIVVNIGDALEVWSNGVYKSIEHRAVTNEKRSRMSIATFLIPSDEVDIGPLESMVEDKNHPRMYKKIKYLDFLRHSLGGKLDGKAHTEFLKLHAE
ncbi:hypothetical protein LWI29_022056 [Acer saccharum]|uniref:Fe2OG dioxygenase domain-containing protein n=1 Tax=Acer saccharum TaxID=4024 RepID=A0AA39SEB7_ACESA|nr:hypothetical protein LWI29_022056 [Acer saccharum]